MKILLLVIFLILYLIPHEYLNNIGIDFIPDRYWFVAIPTHFFVTLVYIYIVVKGINYYITEDNPIKEGIY